MAEYNPYQDPNVNLALGLTGSQYRLDPSEMPEPALPHYMQYAPELAPVPEPMPEPVPMPEQVPMQAAPLPADPVAVQQALQATGSAYQAPIYQAPPVDQSQIGSSQSAQAAMMTLDQAAEDQARAAYDVAQIRGQGGAQESAVREQSVSDLGALTESQSQARADMDAEMQRIMSELRAANEAAAKMPSPKDSRTTMRRLAGAFAVGGGAIADHHALVGGVKTDHAQQIQAALDKGIERDIQAQREAVAGKRADAQAKVTEYTISRQYFGDTMEADRFEFALHRERTAAELAQIAANTTNQEVKAQVQGLSAQYRADAAKEKLAVYKSVMAKKLNPYQARLMGLSPAQAADYNNSVTAEAGAPLPVPDHRTTTQRGADSKEYLESSIPGRVQSMPPEWYTPDRQKKADALASSTAGVIALGNHLADMFDRVNNAKTPQDAVEARTDYVSAKESYLSAISLALEQGVITASDAARMSGAVPPAPPANFLDRVKQDVTNYWQGTEYSSRAIRAYGQSLGVLNSGKLTQLGYPPAGAAPQSPAPERTAPERSAPAKPAKRAKKPKGFTPG